MTNSTECLQICDRCTIVFPCTGNWDPLGSAFGLKLVQPFAVFATLPYINTTPPRLLCAALSRCRCLAAACVRTAAAALTVPRVAIASAPIRLPSLRYRVRSAVSMARKKEKKQRTVVHGAKGALAGKVIGRPPPGTPPCAICNDKVDSISDPLISKVGKVPSVDGHGSALYQSWVGHRICRRTQCFKKQYQPESKVCTRYRYRNPRSNPILAQPSACLLWLPWLPGCLGCRLPRNAQCGYATLSTVPVPPATARLLQHMGCATNTAAQ